MLFVLGQDASITRSVLIHRSQNSIKVQESAITITAVFGLIISLIFFFNGQILIGCICLGSIVIAINQTLSIISIAKKDFRTYNFSRIINQLLAFISTVALVFLATLTIENRLLLIVLGFLIGVFAFKQYIVKFNVSHLFKRNNLALNYSILTGIFLLLLSLSNIIRLRIDKIIFLPSLDKIEASNIALASMLVIVISTLMDSFVKIYVYRIYESFDKKSKRIPSRNIFLSLIFGSLIAVISLFLYLIPEDFYALIFGAGFERVGYYASILLAPYSLFPAYLYSINHAIYLKKTAFLGLSSLVSALIWVFVFYTVISLEVPVIYAYLAQIILFLPNIIFSSIFNWGYNEKHE